MGMRPAARMPKLTRRSRILIAIALAVVVLLLVGPRFIDTYVDWLWFGELGYRRLEWKCNARNARSMRAAERFGFSYEGLFRQHMIVKGENRDTAWYALIDSEWPQCRQAFQHWLAADNFDAEGRQKRRLEELRD